MDKRLFEILVCPICKSQLVWQERDNELVCRADRLAYPVRDDVPVMLEIEARTMTLEEVEALR